MRITLIFFGPPILVFVIGLCLLALIRRRRAVELQVVAPQFFGHFFAAGAIAVACLILIVIGDMVIHESPQAPLMLLFSPWAFTLGAAAGIARWYRKQSKPNPAFERDCAKARSPSI